MKFGAIAFLLLTLLGLAACGGAPPTATPAPVPTVPPPAAPAAGASSAGHITVQHILIGFQGTVPGKNITRTQEQARTLAYQLLAQAKAGANFDQLVAANTDDAPPGIYSLSDTGVAPNPGEYPREQMVPAFGNVGFALKPGEIGIADYDPQTSPFGYHIIKRLR
jgi:hypothetical protein